MIGRNWSSHFGFLFSVAETMEKKLVEETKQLELDLNDERLRYQNLLNEFSRLEERYDDLKDEMNLMVVSGGTWEVKSCSQVCLGRIYGCNSN